MEKDIKSLFQLDVCNGIPVPVTFDRNAFESVMNYKPKPGEVVIVTYPKCGTTWMHHIVLLILRKGKVSDDSLDFFLGCPFVELTGADDVDFMSKVAAIKTHIPFRALQNSADAKYIYVARNPYDCCVSFYYHMKMMPSLNDFSFDSFFDYFLKGEVGYGDYFDHLLDGYGRRNDANVYFITYEAIKKNPKEEILKLAKFIGEDYENIILEDSKVLDDIILYSSFDYMKKHVNESFLSFFKGNIISDDRPVPSGFRKSMEKMKIQEDKPAPTGQFVRKGIVGDWKNHFTAEQKKALDEKIANKTADSDVMNLWKDI